MTLAANDPADGGRHGALAVECITRWDELEPWRDEWNRLAGTGETATIFQTFEWHRAWWKSFGAGLDLRVVLVHRGERLAGVAPMVVEVDRLLGLRRRVLGFLGASNRSSDYCDFLAEKHDADTLRALLDGLVERRRDWQDVDLYNLPSESFHRPLVETYFRERGCAVVSERLCDAPTRLLGDAEEDRHVLEKKSLRRHTQYFRRQGKLSFRHCDDAAEVRELLPVFFRQHVERRALTPSPSLFLDRQQQDFYRGLVAPLCEAGWLRFAVLQFDDEPIAFHFGFEFAGRYVWYKPSFAVAHMRRSPGEVMIRFLLEYAVERKLAEFDFTVGGEDFKFRFANHVRSNHRIQVMTSSLRHRLLLLRRAIRRRFR